MKRTPIIIGVCALAVSLIGAQAYRAQVQSGEQQNEGSLCCLSTTESTQFAFTESRKKCLGTDDVSTGGAAPVESTSAEALCKAVYIAILPKLDDLIMLVEEELSGASFRKILTVSVDLEASALYVEIPEAQTMHTFVFRRDSDDPQYVVVDEQNEDGEKRVRKAKAGTRDDFAAAAKSIADMIPYTSQGRILSEISNAMAKSVETEMNKIDVFKGIFSFWSLPGYKLVHASYAGEGAPPEGSGITEREYQIQAYVSLNEKKQRILEYGISMENAVRGDYINNDIFKTREEIIQRIRLDLLRPRAALAAAQIVKWLNNAALNTLNEKNNFSRLEFSVFDDTVSIYAAQTYVPFVYSPYVVIADIESGTKREGYRILKDGKYLTTETVFVQAPNGISQGFSVPGSSDTPGPNTLFETVNKAYLAVYNKAAYDQPDKNFPTYAENIAKVAALHDAGLSTEYDIQQYLMKQNQYAFEKWFRRLENKFIGQHNKHAQNLKTQLEIIKDSTWSTDSMDNAAKNEANAVAHYRSLIRIIQAVHQIEPGKRGWGSALTPWDMAAFTVKCQSLMQPFTTNVEQNKAIVRTFKVDCIQAFVLEADKEAQAIYARYKEIGIELAKTIEQYDTVIEVLEVVQSCLFSVMKQLPYGDKVTAASKASLACINGNAEDCKKEILNQSAELVAGQVGGKIGDVSARRVNAAASVIMTDPRVRNAIAKGFNAAGQRAGEKLGAEQLKKGVEFLIDENITDAPRVAGTGAADDEERCLNGLAAGGENLLKKL